MQITDLLKRESVELNGSAGSKAEALDKLIQLMVKQGNIADPEEYRKKVFAREEEGSTGVGEGVAIPHAKTAAVTRPGLWPLCAAPTGWNSIPWTASRPGCSS